MNTCFVIQPFDEGGAYDKRFEAVFAPAIRNAGLEPYRVDRDPGVSIPIDQIENAIRNSQVCFAEISTDNPNVWFELGFAIAAQKEVALVCSEERKTRFPFDVQHRTIIKYLCSAPQDFDALKQKITDRVKAIVEKEQKLATMATAASISPVKDTEGLAPHEIVALVSAMQNWYIGAEPVSVRVISADMNRSGYNDFAAAMALASLQKKGMVNIDDAEYHGDVYKTVIVASPGQNWLLANLDRLQLREPPAPEPPSSDDIPF